MPAKKRKGLSKKTRFEVFKRDSFTCQYCGQSAPDVVLRCDHIHPVSDGGEDDLLNLVTACFDCNAGKSDRLLSDNAVVSKQRAQLAELNERREQLTMLLDWREGLRRIEDQTLEAINDAWRKIALGYHLNDKGLEGARRYLRKYGTEKVLNALDTARTYIRLEKSSDENKSMRATADSAELAWSKVGGILAMGDKPESERRMHYVKGILRNRVSVNIQTAMDVMRRIVAAGGDMDYVESYAKECRSWTQWRDEMWEYATELEMDLATDSDEGVIRTGRRLGIEAQPGEEMDAYRSRVRWAMKERK